MRRFASARPWPRPQAPTPKSEPTRLLKIVALTRHGVRAPTQKAKTLALWSTRAWPQWPVPQGWLTPRGGQLVTAMWEDLRGELLRLGILPEGVCPPPGRIFVRADVDQRTRATARALLDGLAPGCNRGYAVADTDPRPPSSIPSSPASTPLTRPRWPAKCCAWPTAT